MGENQSGVEGNKVAGNIREKYAFIIGLPVSLAMANGRFDPGAAQRVMPAIDPARVGLRVQGGFDMTPVSTDL
jgi:hypothetical protein